MSADESVAEVGGFGGPPVLPVFPPMSNSFVVGVATVPLFTAGELAEIRTDLEAGAASAVLGRKLSAAIVQANASYFRFDITLLDGEDEPVLERVGAQPLGWGLSRVHSTRKLLAVVLCELPEGRATVTAHIDDLDRREDLAPGTLLLVPSFLRPRFDLADTEEMVVIVTHAYGPSFQ